MLISSSQDGVAVIEAVVDLYKLLGLKVKESKSILKPQVQLEHLGFLLDCSQHTITLPGRKLQRVAQLCKNLLGHLQKNRRWVSKRKLARVVGYLQSCTYALPFGRFYLAHLYAAFPQSHGWDGNVKVTNKALSDLKHYWLRLTQHTVQRHWFTPQRTVILCTDACS